MTGSDTISIKNHPLITRYCSVLDVVTYDGHVSSFTNSHYNPDYGRCRVVLTEFTFWCLEPPIDIFFRPSTVTVSG